MLSPVTPYSLLKMHWSPEHTAPISQWPEQHLDVTSTTSPPSVHKHEPYAPAARRNYAHAAYPWASDDISALTASSLLKRYAEKYSGLELPYERPASGAYPDPGAFLKTESEPWTLSQGIECYPGIEALTGTKVGSGSVGIPTTGSVTVVSSNLASDPGYSAAGSCNAPSSQDYPPAYNSTYLSSGYCPQPGTALPPGPLHSLQAAPTLVPSYSSSTPVYNYPPGCYPQNSLTSSYSHPSASYLPPGISAPTPLAPRPTMAGGSYSYPSHSLGGGVEAGAPLKRKAFEMGEDGQEGAEVEGSRYRKYSNGLSKGNGHGNGYDISGSGSDPQPYKPGKPLMSPPYRGTGDYSPPTGLVVENASGEHSFPHQRMPMKIPASRTHSEDPPGGH
ncbi:fidgetin-like protein 2 [Corythoichthys intestinalis]|uniref:fidgetin-like protein 2 n=1 Tax=Corythoichthys intestinalis TaxID=161448 RepID=UPI0025A5DC35|nr:fidgetin-like protein 2 [Corythoichthys intestinalis]XP_057702742.1 fidgetin-like protein 2 [Corythoichthys intestinalis]XP_057702743.1 fidgetin-like protein 2 [Corythoichthys intestinalis]